MKKFYIPQVDDNVEKKKESTKQSQPKYRSEPFVSTFFGTKVKDEITFTGAQFGNKGLQYDPFRDEDKRIKKEYYKDYLINPAALEDRNPKVEGEDYTKTMKFEKKENDEPEYYETLSYESKLIQDQNQDNFKKQEEKITEEFQEIEKVAQYKPKEQESKPKTNKNKYIAPPLSLLNRGRSVKQSDNKNVLFQLDTIDRTLSEFNIAGHVVRYTKGPAVTQFEVQLEPGIKVQKVKSIASNLQANLKARTIRIQAPIPGKSTIGIEVPNLETDIVLFGDLLANDEFLNDGNPMNVVLGLGLDGNPVYLNIAKMPHCLIGGTTGSGKSVCINSMITSILYKAHPDDVKLILIDPKIIEFSNYEDLPHLATPVITEPKVAASALKWAVEEMENRYQLFRSLRVREYEEYSKIASTNLNVKHIPYIVIIIDELADLMLVAGNDVEDYIQRLTQKGRASGIHLIIATQRPSVDVIKGTIKTNIPTRIAFLVKTQVDSSIILDHSGAEKLLGNGDMLYNDSISEERLQGAFISPKEIQDVTNFIRHNSESDFIFTTEDLQEKITEDGINDGINDEYFQIIARFVVENQNASINRIQKTFGIGFNRAQAIIQGLEELGSLKIWVAERVQYK